MCVTPCNERCAVSAAKRLRKAALHVAGKRRLRSDARDGCALQWQEDLQQKSESRRIIRRSSPDIDTWSGTRVVQLGFSPDAKGRIEGCSHGVLRHGSFMCEDGHDDTWIPVSDKRADDVPLTMRHGCQ